MPYIVDNDSSAVEDPFHNHELRQSLRNLAYHTAVNMSHSRNRILILINELYFGNLVGFTTFLVSLCV